MASAVSAPPITIEQYLTFESPAGYYDELIHGRIIVSPDPRPLHNDVVDNICRLLRAALGDAYKVGQRVNFRFPAAFSMPSPDVFVINKEDWKRSRDANEYPEGQNASLFVEVVSPENRGQKLRGKAELYNGSGVELWIVYPKKREIRVHRAEKQKVHSTGRLALPASLPEASIKVADVFKLA